MHPARRQLQRLRLLVRGSRMVVALAGVAALVAALWLAFGLADAAAAFEPAARRAITAALLFVSAIALCIAVFRALRITLSAVARMADDALGDPRRPASAALSIHADDAATPLARMLAERSLDECAGTLSALPWTRMVSWGRFGRVCAMLAVPIAIAFILRAIAPAAFDTVAHRLWEPSADIPPYSPLRFAIDPAQPSAVYGGEVLVSAEITGGELNHPVVALVRQPRTGRVLSLPAFRESGTRFSRKLDALTEPVEIAFSCGKARSPWHAVEILLEPEILGGIVRITPPEYTRLAPAEFPLDTNEIAAIEGAEVTLELTSNRPLSSGVMEFTPAAVTGEEPAVETIQGSIPSQHTVSFTWRVVRGGRLAVSVRDVRGTPGSRPLELALRLIPDQAPTVYLSSPPVMMLATPNSRIPVVGRADDDFALSKVHVVRALSGFRDRSHVIAPALREKSYDFNDALDLAELGLQPGQTIEIMLDASDHNPSLLGHGSSEISRIRIISDEQYAETIRSRTTLREFANRFRAAREAMEQAREALEQLKQAVEEGDKKAIEEAAKAARDIHGKAAELMEKIAEDFPAFEMEDRLKELAEKQVEDLRRNIEPLEQFDKDAPKNDQKKAVEEMMERLNQNKEEAEQLDDDMEFHQNAAQLLEMAAKFREIYENQVSVAKRFGTIVGELRRGEDQNRRLLPMLGETQEKNRKALDDFKAELKRRIEALPDDERLDDFKNDAGTFLEALETAEPETLMDAATKHGRAGEAMDAFTNAERARALLESLLNHEENAFAAAARGEAPEFDADPDVNGNLRQMLEAMLGRAQGQGRGNQPGGQGMDGMADGGFPMHLPMVGPERMRFGDGPNAGGRAGGEGRQGGAPPLPGHAEKSSIRPSDSRLGQSTTSGPESIPEPYREAVKRFLTP